MGVGDRYSISIEIDRYRPVPGEAVALTPDFAATSFQDAYELFQQVRRGRTMRIRTANGVLTYDLTGTSRALAQVADCLSQELDREFAASRPAANPFAAGMPQSVGSGGAAAGFARLDRTELIILASNVLAEAGISGHRFLGDQERTGAFADLDVAWVGPGNYAGGLTGVQIGSVSELEALLKTVGPQITAADATSCGGGKFASIPTPPSQENGVYRLDLQHVCATDSGQWSTSYSFIGLDDGRLFRFVMMEVDDGTGIPDAADPGPEIMQATFSGAAERVVYRAQ